MGGKWIKCSCKFPNASNPDTVAPVDYSGFDVVNVHPFQQPDKVDMLDLRETYLEEKIEVGKQN